MSLAPTSLAKTTITNILETNFAAFRSGLGIATRLRAFGICLGIALGRLPAFMWVGVLPVIRCNLVGLMIISPTKRSVKI